MKNVYLLSITILVALTFTLQSDLYAQDGTTGIKFSLRYWQPSWDWEVETDYGRNDGDEGSTTMIGVNGDIMFDNFGIGFNYMVGSWDMEEAGYSYETTRKDLDLYLQTKTSNYFSIFGGIKYLVVSTSGDYIIGVDHEMLGIGGGFGGAIPLTSYPEQQVIPFLFGNLSLVYFIGDEYDPDFSEGAIDLDWATYNLEFGVGMSIQQISFTLGYRMQTYYAWGDVDYQSLEECDNFKGLTLSAAFSTVI